MIAPTALRDYAKAHGWTLLKEAAQDRLYVLSNPAYDKRQLVFPMDTTAPDYAEAVQLILDKLAYFERRNPESVLKSLLEVNDDGVAFRVSTARPDEHSLPLAFAGSVVAGAQQMIMAAACTVLRPQAHHPRLSRTESEQLLEAAKFRHTAPGSFILNVSCPVHAMDIQAPLLESEEHIPFVRRATMTIRRSLAELVTAIETDSLASFVAAAKTSERPIISANFCEALTLMQDEALQNSLTIEINWAASIPRPPNEPSTSVIRVQHDYFPRIEEVRRELRADEEHTDDTFIGTVERLSGEMGSDGNRSGEVILSLLLPEGEQVRARTILNPEQYKKADQAHMTDGAYVKVSGRLSPGRQPRQLSELRSFDLILK